MDLLNEIEDQSNSYEFTVKAKQDESQSITQNVSLLGPTFHLTTTGPDLSILNRIKSRLQGEGKYQDDLAETQKIIPKSGDSGADSGADSGDDTGGDSGADDGADDGADSGADDGADDGGDTGADDGADSDSVEQIAPSFQFLPQLKVDESEYINAKIEKITSSNLEPTQVIPINKTLPNLFVSDDECQEENETPLLPQEENETPLLSNEERQSRIIALAEQKRQERLIREREALEQDVSKGTITDEENDLNNEANDTVVSSHMKSDGISSKELEKAQEFINIQKRKIDIRPAFESTQVFTKDRFLSAFSDDEEEEEKKKKMMHDYEDEEEVSSKVGGKSSSPRGRDYLKSSPTTSPVKDHQEENVYDLFQLKKHKTPTNPIATYINKLKQDLVHGGLTLDSDSDIEVGHSSSPIRNQFYKTQMTNRGNELDIIPELSKEKKLMIRQKYSKKKYQNCNQQRRGQGQGQGAKIPSYGNKQNNDFLKQLHKRNIHQLKVHKLNDPDYALREEFEKEEESMTSLLEREMERVRNIRKKEKLEERAKLALLRKKELRAKTKGDYSGSEEEEMQFDEVADSEVPESEQEEEEEEEEEDSDRNNHSPISQISYDQEVAKDNDQSQEEETSVIGQSNLHELFQNLQPRQEEDSFISTQHEVNAKMEPKLPQFEDLPQTQGTQQTQVDAITQVDSTTLDDFETQIINRGKHIDDEEEGDNDDDDEEEDNDDDDDDDVITPAQVSRGRRAMRNKLNQIKDEKVDQEHENEMNEKDEQEQEEALKQRLREYEQKLRIKELKLRKKRKEMERRGLKDIVEGEAEESEDEWKGLGGVDGEFSDVANSEDEKMIDNDFNIDLQDEAIKKKFMEDYKIKDQKELEKLLDDIKNHRLIKRVANNGLDIELSDEEDQLLAAYRKQKYQEQQSRLLKNKKLQTLSKNEKSKAFFATIQDKNEVIIIDSENEDDDDDDDEEKDKEGEIANPFGKEKGGEVENSNGDEGEDDEEDEEDEVKESIKKTVKIKQSFVQKQLSFLHKSVFDDDDELKYQKIQKLSNIQHGFSEDEDDLVDMNALKSRSSLNLGKVSRKRSIDDGDTDVDEDTQKDNDKCTSDGTCDNDDDVNDGFMPVFKKPSIVKSFKSFQEQQGITIKDGKQHFSGVTISKQYKVVSGSKASITFMSKKSNHLKNGNPEEKRNSKQRQIERDLNNFKRNSTSSAVFSTSGFI
ncbi:hypothetical protein KGF56_001409 [Candida oxycetoniae]|uniref:DNA replication checkpoint mediator MRC1 domain-containing protein n=1 Tax=Candida oxycetoniae TaxID=497107 RepID=A0AAI9SZC7_9ASCO|nr:uncharacterized protein KGF56_001409 [Candida oxycetoniae]KAI3405802.2 hypothetical protein KGF56_001409 [Candida oxycetoniae]